MATGQSALCGGCAGTVAEAPREPFNRPGLPTVAYRIGDYASFNRTQLALLSSSSLGKLSELRTRELDDFSLALIDSWSVVGDILSFYSERLLNEAFLGTAADPLSLREMARLIGFRPQPGVAAGAVLAFTASETPGSPDRVAVPLGSKVQSTPGQDEVAVTFETSAAIEARPAWNAIRPRQSQPHPLPAGVTSLHFAGLQTGLKPGDAVFFTAQDGALVFGLVRKTTPKPGDKAADPAAQDTTEVEIERIGGAPSPAPATLPPVLLDAVVLTPAAQLVWNQTLAAKDIEPLLAEHGLAEQDVFGPYQALPLPTRYVWVFRRRAAVFGHNAPALDTLPQSLIGQTPAYSVDGGVVTATGLVNGPFFGFNPLTQWAEGNLTVLAGVGRDVYLDTTYEAAGAGSFVVLRNGAQWSLSQVDASTDLSLNRFTISAKSTRLTLSSSSGFASFPIRSTSVYVESERLALARTPIPASVTDGNAQALELDGWYPGLEVGQSVIVSGAAIGGGRELAAEAATLLEVEHRFVPGAGTRIKLTPSLTGSYARKSARISANVVPATHGESVFEVLGSGDSSVAFQTFKARQAPQTYITAAVPGGAMSTLQVRVNDVLWTEVPNFLGRAPDERVYVTRSDAEGRTVVTFGDGRTGARPPTGADNVRARYRKGLGLAGRVRAHQLNQLMSRPLGLAGADNPLPASGGADPQPGDSVRANAPLTVRTLDRAVSLLDYEDFARAYAGVAKALAVPMWDGTEQTVFITVAGEAGAPIPDPSAIRTALVGSIASAGDPYVRFDLATHVPAYFRFAGAVKVDLAFLPDLVLAAVEAALRDVFSFARRAFAQPVAMSEVIAAIHGVPGVVAANVTSLYRGNVPARRALIGADQPRRLANGRLRAAELLTLDPGPLDALVTMP